MTLSIIKDFQVVVRSDDGWVFQWDGKTLTFPEDSDNRRECLGILSIAFSRLMAEEDRLERFPKPKLVE